jgi:hypothetical protein
MADLATIAADEYDHARALLSAHTRTCDQDNCANCASLTAHAVRTAAQALLLTPHPDPAETMF